MFKLIFDNIYCSCFPCSDSLSWFTLRKCLPSIQVWITIVCQLSFQIKMVFHEKSQLVQLAADIMQVFRTTFKLQYAAGVRFYIFLIEGSLLYSIVVVSSKHQHESAIGLPMSPSTWTRLPPPSPSHPSGLLPSPSLRALSHTTDSHWLPVLYMVMYVSML